jgi:hypothetical protein
MHPAEIVEPSTHQRRGGLARGAIALATAAFAETMRAWIWLLSVKERVSIARRRKACVLVRALGPVHPVRRGVTVTVTGLAPGEGRSRPRSLSP